MRFEEAIPRAQVPHYTAQADILVLVQKEVLYGSSNKLYDYMAAGKPIVCALRAEHNSLVERARCGASADPDDAEDLAEKLLMVARLSVEERRAIGKRGHEYVWQHHDYSVLARRLMDVLEELDNREGLDADRQATV